MASLADHAYVIGDAEIECLVFDADNFTERARELKAQYPNLILLGFGPNDVGDDYLRAWQRGENATPGLTR